MEVQSGLALGWQAAKHYRQLCLMLAFNPLHRNARTTTSHITWVTQQWSMARYSRVDSSLLKHLVLHQHFTKCWKAFPTGRCKDAGYILWLDDNGGWNAVQYAGIIHSFLQSIFCAILFNVVRYDVHTPASMHIRVLTSAWVKKGNEPMDKAPGRQTLHTLPISIPYPRNQPTSNPHVHAYIWVTRWAQQ